MSESTPSSTIKLGTVTVLVPDVETLDRCRDWYAALGLPKMDFDEPGESYWFDVGNSVLLGIHTGAESPLASFAIYLNVVNVDETYRHLLGDGFEFDSEPETKFWGRFVQLKDPAGTVVRLVTEA